MGYVRSNDEAYKEQSLQMLCNNVSKERDVLLDDIG
jgi:hypothetical protein